MYSQDLEISEGYCRQALRKFKNLKDREGEAGSLTNLGIIVC